MKQMHLISGLPRSGTTLLSTILNQNPRFSASISGPLARMIRALVQESQAQAGYRTQCPEDKLGFLIQNLVENYYKSSNDVVFDTNRGWTLMTALMGNLFPKTKMICCVRDINWVIDSFEQLVRKNFLTVNSMFSPEENQDVYTRARTLIRSDRTVGFALNSLKQAVYGNENESLLLVNYEDLCLNPEAVMKDIYNFLSEPYYAHDYNNVEASYDEFDSELNLKGLHTIRKKIEYKVRDPILPPDLWLELEQYSFWKNPIFNKN